MIRLYHELARLFGEPDDCWVFDPAEAPKPNELQLLHVPAWLADDRCDVTSFNTLGMSNRRMKGADYFTELHFAFRGSLPEQERLQVARFLADVALYPFIYERKLDWKEVITNPERIPKYPGCRHLMLHPRLTDSGIDQLDDREGPVKLLYAVPITPKERHVLVEHGERAFRAYLAENGIDLLTDRQDPPEWYEQQ
jgi:hypothetical protein